MPKETSKTIERMIRLLAQQGVKLSKTGYGEALSNYILACADLCNALDSYYRENFNGNLPTLRETDVTALRDRYLKVFYTAQEAKNAAKADRIDERSEIMNSSALMDTLNAALGPELAALSGTLSRDNMTLPELIDQARGVSIDISGAELSNTGGMLSNRIPVTYTDNSGTVRRGFFTETVSTNRAAEFDALIDRVSGGNPEYRKYFLKLAQDPSFSEEFKATASVQLLDTTLIESQDTAATVQEFMENYPVEQDPEAHAQMVERFTKDPDFNLNLIAFARGYHGLNHRYQVHESSGIENNDRVEERNIGMSVVADLLGVSGLLARSVKMELVRDGKKQSGVFMEFAPGSDILHLKENDPMLTASQQDMDTPAARKSLADLQVLDYLCANTDRHVANMFYQFDPQGKLTGVVGIDNDCSFGKLNQGDVMQMVKLENMNVITRSMADRICALTPDVLDVALRNITLTYEERESARNRLLDLQSAIARGREHYRGRDDAVLDPGCLRVVEDSEWERFNYSTLGTCSGKNYFQIAENLSETAHAKPAQQQKEAQQQEQLRALDPSLAPAKAAPRNEQVMEYRIIDDRGLGGSQKEFKVLDAELRKVNSGAFIGSKQFDDVIRAYANVKALAQKMGNDPLNWDIRRMDAAYKNLENKLQAYTDKKLLEEKALAQKGKRPSKTAQDRVAFAEALRGYSQAQRYGLNQELHNRAYATGSLDAILAEGKLPECERISKALTEYRKGNADALAQTIAEGIGTNQFLRDTPPNSTNRFQSLELYGGLMDMVQADPALNAAVTTRLPTLKAKTVLLKRAMEVRNIARWSDEALDKLRNASETNKSLSEQEKKLCLTSIFAEGAMETSLSTSAEILIKPGMMKNVLSEHQKNAAKGVEMLSKKSAGDLFRSLDSAKSRMTAVRTITSNAPRQAVQSNGRHL